MPDVAGPAFAETKAEGTWGNRGEVTVRIIEVMRDAAEGAALDVSDGVRREVVLAELAATLEGAGGLTITYRSHIRYTQTK